MDPLSLALLAGLLLLILFAVIGLISFRRLSQKNIERQSQELSALREEILHKLELLDYCQDLSLKSVNDKFGLLQDSLNDQLTRQSGVETANLRRLEDRIRNLEQVNEKKLDEIRGTVEEKLQTALEKRISESFRTVNEQLESVYKSLGEMQTLAADVGGLKKVLSGVKTRGILGEVQLAAILEEILTPEQYECNCATVPGSTERVEFAVRLPGTEDGPVYLPIDSKFPGDSYARLLDAREAGDKELEVEAVKNLESVLKKEAKDIRDKYLSVPYTTNFGILFLPFEGLYAEVVNRGLLEQLRRDYSVNIAGPSTMAALLNSLQMGFRTLAIQKRSGEVWELLGAVKTEFEKFGEVMKKMQGHLNLASDDLAMLMNTRTNVISRKLRDVQKLEDSSSAELLGLDS